MAVTDPEVQVHVELDLPVGPPTEQLEVRGVGPPGFLNETLEKLSELTEDNLLIQLDDRLLQHLYPVLTEPGYEFGTVERADATITAI